MCGIAGSFDKDRLNILAELNTMRGNRAHSLTSVDPKTKKWEVYRRNEPYDGTILDNLKEGRYGIIHVQAPTDAGNTTHPAILGDFGLIHNGLLKSSYLKKYDYQTTWDTEWLLNHMIVRGDEHQNFTNVLNDINGSFSCVLLKQGGYIWLFRNSIAPMYRKGMDISSMPTEGFTELKFDTVYQLDVSGGYLSPIGHFKNIERPYIGV